MTPSAKQAIVDMQPKYMLEQFIETELMINITEHEVYLNYLNSFYLFAVGAGTRGDDGRRKEGIVRAIVSSDK
jgi:hypothetical protein